MLSSRRLVPVAAVLVLVVGVGWFGVSYWSSGHQSRSVALPPGDASPVLVVQRYVAALDAHDCRTAAALTTTSARQQADSWCHDVASLTEVQVDPAVPESASGAADDLTAGVPVTFDLNWRLFHDDGSMPEGFTVWGYELVRASVHDPWRINDQGVG